MPLIAVAVLAYVAGLLCGFAGAVIPFSATTLLLAIIAVRLRRAVLVAIALSACAGALVAAGTMLADVRCSRQTLGSGSHEAVLEEAASPGGFVRARLARCGAAAFVDVEGGSGEAGSRALIHGAATPARRGFVIQRAVLVSSGGVSWRDRWRARATRAVDRVFPADSALARALLVADTRTLSPVVRDRYAAAGLAHMLSISGLHVGIIGLALEVVFQLLRLSRRAGSISAIVVVAVYVALIGAPEAAVRSAVMLGAVSASRLLQRPTSPWALLALGAAAPLVSPRSVLDVGYQLSVAGVGALVAGGALVKRTRLARLRGWRRTLATGLIVSSVATVVTAPLVAWTFGRISLVGPLTNLVAAPLMAVAQPMLFLGLLLAPVHPLAILIGDAAHPVLAAFDAIAAAGAAIPGAWLEVSPSTGAAVLAGVASVALVVACVSRHPGVPAVVGTGCVALLAWSGFAGAGSGYAELHMLDVGQGDALALRTPHGRWVLFDAGRAWRGGDAGRSVVVPYIARRGGALEAFILSHPHTDHVGGASTVVGALHPAHYFDAAFAGGADAYRESLLRARGGRTRWERVRPNDSLVVDGVVIRFLAPDSAWTAGLDDPNLASTIVLARFGHVRFLLVGDAERAEEDWLLDRAGDSLAAEVLKVAHHGSSTSSSARFLDAVRPRVALVSVGAHNSYGHPSASVLTALAARGAQVLRTDALGTVVVRTDGARLFAQARGETWEIPLLPAP